MKKKNRKHFWRICIFFLYFFLISKLCRVTRHDRVLALSSVDSFSFHLNQGKRNSAKSHHFQKGKKATFYRVILVWKDVRPIVATVFPTPLLLYRIGGLHSYLNLFLFFSTVKTDFPQNKEAIYLFSCFPDIKTLFFFCGETQSIIESSPFCCCWLFLSLMVMKESPNIDEREHLALTERKQLRESSSWENG